MNWYNKTMTFFKKYIVLGAFFILSCLPPAQAQEANIAGQLSGWLTVTDDESQLGLRYIPELSLSQQLSPAYEISGEFAANLRWWSDYADWDYTDDTLTVDPYRLWMRFAAPQYEIRAGLQKISFGSATLLRPLMWFDTLDPRDPLQLTEGVYGLLGRYFFQNNANIWLWALTGNDDQKGWELLPTDKWSIEYGGRIQLPSFTGEIGFSYDHRTADSSTVPAYTAEPATDTFTEDRFALDGKWDVGVGLWFESALMRQDLETLELAYQRLVTIGMDYTFSLGNGLHLLAEHFDSTMAEHAFDAGENYTISAFSADYPVGILDTLMSIVYYNWQDEAWSSFLSWQRSYDQWSLNVNFFSNPDEPLLDRDNSLTSGFAGRGVQCLLVFNH
ncbi:MAG: hypothetical protein ACI8ZB_001365 [Desulforhopalus sp.]|jgi:hypothetical protein